MMASTFFPLCGTESRLVVISVENGERQVPGHHLCNTTEDLECQFNSRSSIFALPCEQMPCLFFFCDNFEKCLHCISYKFSFYDDLLFFS